MMWPPCWRFSPCPGAGRMAEEQRDLPGVPVRHVGGSPQLPGLGEALEDAGLVVLVGVEDQQVLPLIGLHQLGEGGQLLLMDGDDRAVVIVDGTVRHLEELSR